ncbi:MAG: alpha-L-arabinofuranosidase, partial [Phycisphaerae bacterium]|nr:alpha-L-arabinofuranosidase [Phycisphaerae bacterium]
EMYGSWQLGNVPLAQYVNRHNAFVDAIRKVDPDATLIAVGAAGDWSRTMLEKCADHMSHISEHVYWQGRDGLLAHVKQAPESLRRIAEAHRAYRRDLPSLKGRDIRIVQDEWNYWYGPEVFGELGTRYFMNDALGCAAALNEFTRNSDLFFMANYAQTVNVIGAIKTTKESAALETTGLVLKLYRRQFGTLPVRVATSPTLDASAAWSTDKRKFTIAIVNTTTRPAKVPLSISGVSLRGTGTRYTIAGDPKAHNDPSDPMRVIIREAPVGAVSDTLELEACSVTLLSLDVN